MRTMIVVTGVQSPQIYGRPEGEAVQPEMADDIDFVD